MAPACGECGGELLYDGFEGGWWMHGHQGYPPVLIRDTGTGPMLYHPPLHLIGTED